MAFLFKRNPKTPTELVHALSEQLGKLDSPGDRKKAREEVSRYLESIRSIIDLLPDSKENKGQESITSGLQHSNIDQIAELAHEVYSTDVLYPLLSKIQKIEFDARKNVVALFSSLLRRRIGDRSPTIDYLMGRPQIIALLLEGPDITEVSLNMGIMLREALQYEQICGICLSSPQIWQYFGFCRSDSFEKSTEAFSTLSMILTTHRKPASQFIDANMEQFINEMNQLIVYPNYVTKRESIKLLSQLILTKTNYNLMTAYVNSPHNLKLVMILLGDKSRNIQLEAFNVFKVFVANPHKNRATRDILIKNRDRLLSFLTEFHTDNSKYDDLFVAEKTFVLDQIRRLPKIRPKICPSAKSIVEDHATIPEEDHEIIPEEDHKFILEEHQKNKHRTSVESAYSVESMLEGGEVEPLQKLCPSFLVDGMDESHDQLYCEKKMVGENRNKRLQGSSYLDPKRSAQNVYTNTRDAFSSNVSPSAINSGSSPLNHPKQTPLSSPLPPGKKP